MLLALVVSALLAAVVSGVTLDRRLDGVSEWGYSHAARDNTP